jgi:hypothetical protein
MTTRLNSGPILNQDGGPRAPDTPVDQRWSDAAMRTKLSPSHTAPASSDPYGTAGLPGLKSK